MLRGLVDKVCENCSAIFACGGYQCWCGGLEITRSQMKWIAERFRDCLCPVCLKKVSTGELGPQISDPID